MFTVYESKLNRNSGEAIITRMVIREDEMCFWSEPIGAEPTSYDKSNTFRNRADAEKANELLATKGQKAALEFAEAIRKRESKKASKVTV
jgi:hypothetical protein